MNKTLVAYFSASGTTRKIAEMIAEVGDFSLYEITPKELYTSDDLNWMNKKSRSLSLIHIFCVDHLSACNIYPGRYTYY